ncbi:MAG: hypothetical protein RL095_1666 [Verrucomicrobiota bacterium]|jgi:hypothetical protein
MFNDDSSLALWRIVEDKLVLSPAAAELLDLPDGLDFVQLARERPELAAAIAALPAPKLQFHFIGPRGPRSLELLGSASQGLVRDATLEWELSRQHEAILRAQGLLIGGGEAEVFSDILNAFLAVSGSHYGYIGQRLINSEGKPFLKTWAITDISWSQQTREFYEKHAPAGLEFYNLKSLFGVPLVTGQLLISNDPANHPDSCGGPPAGHPPLRHFISLPLATLPKKLTDGLRSFFKVPTPMLRLADVSARL